LADNREEQARYEWILLELYDQMTRNVRGGRMKYFLERELDGPMARFVATRMGEEGNPLALSTVEQPTLWRTMRRVGLEATKIREALVGAFAFLLLGKKGSLAVREGFFRRSGEVHQWMYDRYSLARLLETVGFSEARRCSAGESSISGFADYGLEIVEGRERKPDSLYMEARKPG
jgi:hypothetical protein